MRDQTQADVLTMLLDVASAQIIVEVMETCMPLSFGLVCILWCWAISRYFVIGNLAILMQGDRRLSVELIKDLPLAINFLDEWRLHEFSPSFCLGLRLLQPQTLVEVNSLLVIWIIWHSVRIIRVRWRIAVLPIQIISVWLETGNEFKI